VLKAMRLDFLRFFIIQAGKFVPGLPSARSNSSSLACMACVSRCSARWMNSVISQVATVAAPCQSKVLALNASHKAT
jgi:hypothetical protein